jgi:hypothetical protein
MSWKAFLFDPPFWANQPLQSPTFYLGFPQESGKPTSRRAVAVSFKRKAVALLFTYLKLNYLDGPQTLCQQGFEKSIVRNLPPTVRNLPPTVRNLPPTVRNLPPTVRALLISTQMVFIQL